MTSAPANPTVYLPRQGERAPEPAPYLLTEAEAIRLLRLDDQDADAKGTLRYYRERGMLPAVQVGKRVRFKLPDVLAFLDKAQEANPR